MLFGYDPGADPMIAKLVSCFYGASRHLSVLEVARLLLFLTHTLPRSFTAALHIRFQKLAQTDFAYIFICWQIK
jgi:hypothetical protein